MTHKITIVCSTHREHGRCNASQLLLILQEIEPDVIFEEVRPADFDAFYSASKSLEVQAITQYRQFKPCHQVPVDQYEIRPDLFIRMKNEFDQVMDYVGQSSEEYQQLDGEHVENMVEHGFGYLNSNAFLTREAAMLAIEDAQISALGNPDAMRALETWRGHIQSRELEMVANIYQYCRTNEFDTGVFLIGAAHKAGIVKKIEKYANTESHLIDWRFFEGQIT